MKTIVVPVDFTQGSLNGLNYAADLASAIGGNLLMLHVCPLPTVLTDTPVVPYNLEELVEDAERKLASLKEKIRERTGDSIKITTMVKEGDLMANLEESCSSASTYAVVMGRNNASASDRLLFGSSVVRGLKKLGVALIIVPPGSLFSGIRNIGVASDFREVIDTLPSDEIKRIVNALKANLHVLHVSKDSADALNAGTIEESGWFQDLLGDLKPVYHFIRGANVDQEIIKYADEHKLDLLIVIPKKHGLLEKIIEHSHSKQLVLHAHVPVLAIQQ